jgi:hypothetical protein
MSSNYLTADNGVSSGVTGITQSAGNDGTLQIRTTTSGGTATTAVLIDNAQNVGVGVTPSAWGSGLKVIELGGSSSYFALNNTSATGYIYWNMWYDGTNNKTKQTGNLAAYGINPAGQYVWYNGTGTTGTTSSLTQAMTLDASGNLLIGYTISNGSYKLQVNSQIFATSSTIATSDARYKENVEELSGALDIVKALRPVSFNWKAHPIHNFDTTTKTVGFLAQDVQQTLAGKPYLNSIIKTNECVIEPEVKDKNGNVTKEAVTEEFLGIAEGNMISILTASIQELSAQVTSLQAKVETQATTIATLQNKIGA